MLLVGFIPTNFSFRTYPLNCFMKKTNIVGFVQAPNYDNKVVVVKAPVRKSFVPKEGYTGKNRLTLNSSGFVTVI
jgi:hypothetical protein